jgi:hypothetical protein
MLHLSIAQAIAADEFWANRPQRAISEAHCAARQDETRAVAGRRHRFAARGVGR